MTSNKNNASECVRGAWSQLIYLVMGWAKKKSGQTSFIVLGLRWNCAGKGWIRKTGSGNAEVFSWHR